MSNGDKPAMAVKVVASIAAKRQAEGFGLFCEDVTYTGLTKREHFAGLALQGILASGLEDAAIYECAVHAADKLIKELDK